MNRITKYIVQVHLKNHLHTWLEEEEERWIISTQEGNEKEDNKCIFDHPDEAEFSYDVIREMLYSNWSYSFDDVRIIVKETVIRIYNYN